MSKRTMLRENAKGEWCRAEVELKDSGELSICGSAGYILGTPAASARNGERVSNLPSKYRMNSCGQIVDTLKAFFPEIEPYLKWHLNHMRAGCEHQEAEGWADRPIDPSKPTNTYGKHFPGQRHDSWNMLVWVHRTTPPDPGDFGDTDGPPPLRLRDEHPEGLMCEPCSTCGYRYGSAWLKRELPAEVVAWAKSFGEGES